MSQIYSNLSKIQTRLMLKKSLTLILNEFETFVQALHCFDLLSGESQWHEKRDASTEQTEHKTMVTSRKIPLR